MGRGRGKIQRGGPKRFTVGLGRPEQREKPVEDDDEENEEEEDEEEDDEDDSKPKFGQLPAPSVAAKGKKPADGDEEDEEKDDSNIQNPNRVQPKQVKASSLSTAEQPELSRREREEMEKQAAKERYWKMHLAGKTDEAKRDLARLAEIRAEREAAAKKREEEKLAKEKELAAKMAARKGK